MVEALIVSFDQLPRATARRVLSVQCFCTKIVFNDFLFSSWFSFSLDFFGCRVPSCATLFDVG